MSSKQLFASTPGRICLFGEHQDYLGLPVITAAINLRINISAALQDDATLFLQLPDMNASEEISLREAISYKTERDYLKSAVHVLQQQGVQLPGLQATVRGNIPINSGTSSSSALIVTWIGLLLQAAGDARANDPLVVAKLAHQAEVLEFNEPGGMMDHFSTACGDVLYIDFAAAKTQPLPTHLGTFVLGDSLQPKDTTGILRRVKGGALSALHKLAADAQTLSLDEVEANSHQLEKNELQVLTANIINRELTQQARALFQHKEFDHEKFGALLNRHQEQLRQGLQISTEKIDRMIDAALLAGALGAKINGSGGGGCMFAYAPQNAENVAEAIRRAGGKAWIVQVDTGFYVKELD